MRIQPQSKTIALVSDHAAIGGGEAFLLDLAKCLGSAPGFNVTLLCREEGLLPEKCLSLGVPIHIAHYPLRFRRNWVLPVFSPRILREIGRWIESQEIDLVHANGPFGLLYAGMAARRLKRAVVFSSHLKEDAGRPIKRWLAKKLPHRVIAVSETVAQEWACAGLDARRLTRIPIGIDAGAYRFDAEARRRLRSEWNFNDRHIVCAIIGRIQRVKGQRRFLEAMRLARRQAPALRGLIVGSCWPGDAGAAVYEREINAQLVADESLRSYVVHLPYSENIPAILSATDVLVIASDSESFGRIALEAMACERPVVATPCGGPEEIIVNGRTGLVADSMSADSLAAAMAACAANADRTGMGWEGRKRVKDEFSLEKQTQRIMEVYGEALG
ncbi:MAG: glycosyltransferase family 4 protein [Candidatus Sumerlaeota bacterium]|nr:glycosyltransferase family 4 protein [Candidatus Sumerlaeota bacterium]